MVTVYFSIQGLSPQVVLLVSRQQIENRRDYLAGCLSV